MLRVTQYPYKILTKNRVKLPKLAGIKEKELIREYLQDDGSVLLLTEDTDCPDDFSIENEITINPYRVSHGCVVISALSDITIGDNVTVFKIYGGGVLVRKVDSEKTDR